MSNLSSDQDRLRYCRQVVLKAIDSVSPLLSALAARLSALPFGSLPLRCGSPLSWTNSLLSCVLSMTSSIIIISLPSALIIGKELSHTF
jgi:hypothetical protein